MFEEQNIEQAVEETLEATENKVTEEVSGFVLVHCR